MKLWRLSQTVNEGYDTYSDCIVVAETEEAARVIWPDGRKILQITNEEWWDRNDTEGTVSWESGEWCKPEFVKVEHIGEAIPGLNGGVEGVVCASFHAG